MLKGFYKFLLVFAICVHGRVAKQCVRGPDGSAPRTPADGRFALTISGNPTMYIPGELLTVTLQGSKTAYTTNKFIGFTITVEKDVDDFFNARSDVGSFQLFGDSLTEHSSKCPNAVSNANNIPKSEVQVMWSAPDSGSGCVVIKATVIEHRDVWFMDDGPLSKKLCESQESQDIQPIILDPCCACDEAKYEVTFEGLWSRQTHPKDFPTNQWSTKFSDIIGASHAVDYKFWEYGSLASDGLRQLAEFGSTRLLESELKNKSNKIRTIIKAKGISYPNVTGRTFAVFRVDKEHHLMSLVSMIEPSPDWIVGVSEMELCLSNCSWVEAKVLNLYPWDVGTDSGITYNAPKQPTIPREVIRQLKANYPNDPRSPFYDPTGIEIKPFARLHISREKLYEKKCAGTVASGSEKDESTGPCAVGDWTDWSPCPVTCGKGIVHRQRFYKDPSKRIINNCNVTLTSRDVCTAPQKYCKNSDVAQEEARIKDPFCKLTDWSSFSSCSATCGNGTKTRSRQYVIKAAMKPCRSGLTRPPKLEFNDVCETGVECGEGDLVLEKDGCETSVWSTWTPCSVTCGDGTKSRYRYPMTPKEDDDDPCEGVKMVEIVICPNKPCEDEVNEDNGENHQEGKDEEKEANDDHKDDNDDKEKAGEEDKGKEDGQADNPGGTDPAKDGEDPDANEIDDGKPVDCEITAWSPFSPCNVTCGRGWMTRTREIKVRGRNGGKKCPERLVKHKRCHTHVPCNGKDPGKDGEENGDGGASGDVDCLVSDWGPWSPCSRSCGTNSVQQHVRLIIRPPQGNGRACPHRIESQPCNVMPCN